MNGDEKRIVAMFVVLAFLCGSLLTCALPLIEPLFRVEKVVNHSTPISSVGTQNHINPASLLGVISNRLNRGD